MDRLTLRIDGMTCEHCVAAVRRALESTPGVTVDRVVIGEATISHDPRTANAQRIASIIEGEGYSVVAAA